MQSLKPVLGFYLAEEGAASFDQDSQWFEENNSLVHFSLQELQIEDELENHLRVALQKNAHVYLSLRLQEIVQKFIRPISVYEKRIGATDFLVNLKSSWQCHSLLRRTLLSSFAAGVVPIETQKSALIVGANGQAQMAVAALVQMGVSKFIVCDRDLDQMRSVILRCRRSYLGVQFEEVLGEELVLLPGVNGLLMNFMAGDEDLHSLYELRYFNFLSRGGTVINCVHGAFGELLIRDAKSFGYKVLSVDELTRFKMQIVSELMINNQTKG